MTQSDFIYYKIAWSDTKKKKKKKKKKKNPV